MRTIFQFGSAAALLLALSQPSNAGVVVSIDADPSTPGIQSEASVLAGSEFNVRLIMELTDSTAVNSYALSLRYDEAKFDFVRGSDPQPAGFGFGGADVVLTDQPGEFFTDIDAIDASDFGAGVSAPALFEIASIDFTAGQVGAGAATDLAVGLFGKPQNAFSAPGFVPIPESEITFLGAQISVITAIPEPSVASLMALGVAGVFVRRRRR